MNYSVSLALQKHFLEIAKEKIIQYSMQSVLIYFETFNRHLYRYNGRIILKKMQIQLNSVFK